jgi:hypothetical protein
MTVITTRPSADYVLAIRLSGPSGTSMADLGHLYNNISQIYTEYQKDYPAALHYLKKAIDYNTTAQQ